MMVMAAWMVGAMAQQTQKPMSDERLFNEARVLFEGGDYEAARGYLVKWESSVGASTQGPMRAEEVDYMNAVIESELDRYGAKETVQAFLEKYPNSVHRNRMIARMGTACYLEGDYQEALVWFDECNPDNLGERDRNVTTLNHAITLIKTGNTDEGYVLLTVLEMIGDRNIQKDVTFNKAYVDYERGRLEEAAAGFQKAIEMGGYPDESNLYLAEIKLRQADYDGAAEIATRLIQESNVPSVSVEAERLLGQAMYGKGEYSQAIDLLSSYVQASEGADRMELYQLGMSYYGMKDYDRAIQHLGNAAKGQDELAQSAWLNLGLAYLNTGDKNQARIAFEQAGAIAVDDAMTEQALFNYAMCVEETSYSPFAESVNALDRFLMQFPESKYADQANSFLVDAYLHTNSYDAALASIDRIRYPNTSIMKAKQQLLYSKGVELYASGRYKDAQDYFTQAVDMSTYSRQVAADACFWRAESYYRTGDFRNAAQDYDRYIAMSSDSKSQNYGMAVYGAGYAAYQQNDFKKAQSEWNELIRLAPTINVPNSVLADTYIRVADCYFYDRSYLFAYDNYRKAQEIGSENTDYALYRMGMAKGLLKDYRGKVDHMKHLAEAYPQSSYAALALFEEGRAFQQMDQSQSAVSVFEKIVTDYPATDLARKASAEIATIYFQNDQFDQAVNAYKYVIETYPGSDEAKMAMKDLRSVYVEKGNVNDYIAYSSQVKDAAPIEVSERDSLTYTAAEVLYSRGDRSGAARQFSQYLEQFPNGAFAADAYYYRGIVREDSKDFDGALSDYLHAAGYQFSRFAVNALDRAASMSYRQGDYETALDTYIKMYSKASEADAIQTSLLGIQRSAYKIEEYDAILQYSDKAIQSGIDADQKTEVTFYKAKALLDAGRKADAKPLLSTLSEETRSTYGAESDYLLSQLLFDEGNADQAEKNIMELIQSGTPQSYWLARSFVLLSDIYAKAERKIEARQYLLTLRQNYTTKDDIQEMIETRLANLQK